MKASQSGPVVRKALRDRPGSVVVSMSTSRMVDDLAASQGCPVVRTPVGEIHVVDRMIEEDAVIGGEGNGGVIVPAINPCRDSFVAMALILQALAEEEITVGKMASLLPRYAMVKEKLPCRPRHVAPSLRLLRYHYQGEKMDLTDGVKILWPDQWLHVRPSNTEPIIRILAEADREEKAEGLVETVLEYLKPVCG